MLNETVQIFLLGWVGFCSAAISPGPNMVAVVSRTIGSGLHAGLRVALGIAIGAFFWAWVSVAGFGQLYTQHAVAVPALSLLGGGYLLYLGYKGIRASCFGGSGFIGASVGANPLADVLHGLMVTASNPKVAMMWAALATLVAPGAQSVFAVTAFATVTALLAFLIYGGYSVMFSAGRVQRVFKKYSRWADALFGGVFSVLGGTLLGQLRS